MSYKQDWRGRIIFETPYAAHLYWREGFEAGVKSERDYLKMVNPDMKMHLFEGFALKLPETSSNITSPSSERTTDVK